MVSCSAACICGANGRMPDQLCPCMQVTCNGCLQEGTGAWSTPMQFKIVGASDSADVIPVSTHPATWLLFLLIFSMVSFPVANKISRQSSQDHSHNHCCSSAWPQSDVSWSSSQNCSHNTAVHLHGHPQLSFKRPAGRFGLLWAWGIA